MGDGRLISVRTQVVLETLVGPLADAVAARIGDPLPPPVEDALRRAGGEREQRLARAGYLARAAELERFERAREPMPWLAKHLSDPRGAGWGDTAAGVAGSLAGAEPPGRPDPDDDRAISWRVPGPGGHVRHYLAGQAAGAERDDEGKRAWLMGVLVHCVEEMAPPKSS